MAGLPVAQFPEIVPPEIQLTTTYTGADAETVEQSVAHSHRSKISGVDNMNYMYSVNARQRHDADLSSTSMSRPTEHGPDSSPR